MTIKNEIQLEVNINYNTQRDARVTQSKLCNYYSSKIQYSIVINLNNVINWIDIQRNQLSVSN